MNKPRRLFILGENGKFDFLVYFEAKYIVHDSCNLKIFFSCHSYKILLKTNGMYYSFSKLREVGELQVSHKTGLYTETLSGE